MINAVVIDDEDGVRSIIIKMLHDHCPDVIIAGQADGVQTGIEVINKWNPDLVFLDIRLNDGTGFDLLDRLPEKDFNVIFITAFDEYAIQAIKFSALDYLLKPIVPGDLVEAVRRAQEHMNHEVEQQLNVLSSNLHAHVPKKLVLKTSKHIHFVDMKDVIRCQADHVYTTFHIMGGKKVMVSKPMKSFEEMLIPHGFFRPHKSHLINVSHIIRLEKLDGGTIILSENHKVPLSSRKKEQFLQMMSVL